MRRWFYRSRGEREREREQDNLLIYINLASDLAICSDLYNSCTDQKTTGWFSFLRICQQWAVSSDEFSQKGLGPPSMCYDVCCQSIVFPIIRKPHRLIIDSGWAPKDPTRNRDSLLNNCQYRWYYKTSNDRSIPSYISSLAPMKLPRLGMNSRDVEALCDINRLLPQCLSRSLT